MMNNFPPYNSFCTDEMTRAYIFSVMFMVNVQKSYILSPTSSELKSKRKQNTMRYKDGINLIPSVFYCLELICTKRLFFYKGPLLCGVDIRGDTFQIKNLSFFNSFLRKKKQNIPLIKNLIQFFSTFYGSCELYQENI